MFLNSFVLFTGIESLCTFIVIGIQIIIFIHNWVAYDIKNTVSKISLVFAILCSIFFALSEAADAISVFFGNLHITQFSAVMFLIFGMLSMYGYLLHNLYVNFADTPYSISSTAFIVFIILIIIFAISLSMFDVLYYWDPTSTTHKGIFPIISVFVCTIIDLIITTALALYFIYKLCQKGDDVKTVFHRKKKKTAGVTHFVDLKEGLEDDIEKISDKATKIFTLSIIILLMTQSDNIIFLIYLISKNNISYIIWSVYYPLVRIIVSWLIMLSFDFMNSWYKCCCLNICCNKIKDCYTGILTQDAKLSFSGLINN